MSDAEDKKIPESADVKEGKDPTDELAQGRNAEPGPGALSSTASQVDEPGSDTTPRPQTSSPRQKPETTKGQPVAAGDAAVKTAATGGAAARAAKAAEEKPPEPSPKQQWLDGLVATIHGRLGEGVVEEAVINRMSEDRPTLTVNPGRWPDLARFLKEDQELAFVYLNDIVGVDYGTYFEVVYHLVSIAHREHLTVKVRTDREGATVPSVVSVWPGANWPEREVYDLLGIRFDGHPDLRRIMLPENWVGHPLRKDYEQFDEII